MFAKAAERQGFVITVALLISEFKRYNIAPLQLEAAAAVMEGDLLKEKLAELAVVYKGYEELLSQRYRDADDDLTLAAAKLESSAQYNGAEIWIDGFSGFTPQEYAYNCQTWPESKKNKYLPLHRLLGRQGRCGRRLMFLPQSKIAGAGWNGFAAETGSGDEDSGIFGR